MGERSASRTAQSVLPAPVGPVNTKTGSTGRACAAAAEVRGATASSPTAQEELVQLLQGEARPGRAAVIALVRALGLLHLPQQRIHLGQSELAVRMDRGAAGERPEHTIGGALEVMRVRIEREVVYERLHDARNLSRRKERGHAAERQVRLRQRVDVETRAGPLLPLLEEHLELVGFELRGERLQQQLRGHG